MEEFRVGMLTKILHGLGTCFAFSTSQSDTMQVIFRPKKTKKNHKQKTGVSLFLVLLLFDLERPVVEAAAILPSRAVTGPTPKLMHYIIRLRTYRGFNGIEQPTRVACATRLELVTARKEATTKNGPLAPRAFLPREE